MQVYVDSCPNSLVDTIGSDNTMLIPELWNVEIPDLFHSIDGRKHCMIVAESKG